MVALPGDLGHDWHKSNNTHTMNNTFVSNPHLDMLMSREQLMEDIIAIVDEYFQAQINECDDMGELSNFEEAKDALTSVLCDAVCKNFPAK